MTDLIIIGILGIVCGTAAGYIYKAKKRGAKCIGCPSSSTCSGKGMHPCNGCSCDCGSYREAE